MAASNQVKNQHLLWRAGFGPAVEQLPDLSKYTPKQYYAALLKASESRKVQHFNVADPSLEDMYMEGFDRRNLTPEERRQVQQKQRQGIRDLNLYWLKEMVVSAAQLREKMAFFWHGHFACRSINVFHQQNMLTTIRENALGNFGTLLREVSKSPAMLLFLNAQQNKKDHPNENFAREVMELFTLGRGHYTENDIKEAARAFTGWSAGPGGQFIFRKNQHDDGRKTVLGKSGNFDGDDVLDILLAQPQTATYICTKLYRFLVNEEVDEARVKWLAERFYKNKYEIKGLLEDIFTSDWFYDDKNIGVRIKSPVELLAGIQRMIPMKIENEQALLLLQRILGQLLFYPPNVAGWPGGRTWIDSSTLMMRMRIPQLLNDRDELNVTPKDDDDQMMGMRDKDVAAAKKINMGKGVKLIQTDMDWSQCLKQLEPVGRRELLSVIRERLLQVKPQISDEVIRQYTDASTRDSFIKTATIQIMSTPEYQLC